MANLDCPDMIKEYEDSLKKKKDDKKRKHPDNDNDVPLKKKIEVSLFLIICTFFFY